jgi:hypothetical protein
MEKKNLSSDETLEILMKYIREVDGAAGIAADYLYREEPVTKKVITFTLAELQAIIDSLPQPGGYIHIDDLTKAINKQHD